MKLKPDSLMIGVVALIVIAVILGLVVLALNEVSKTMEIPAPPQAYVGSLPDDICMVNGVPQIYGGSSGDGNFTLVYLRENGEVVIAEWYNQFPGPVDEGYRVNPVIQVYWTGGTCPTE